MRTQLSRVSPCYSIAFSAIDRTITKRFDVENTTAMILRNWSRVLPSQARFYPGRWKLVYYSPFPSSARNLHKDYWAISSSTFAINNQMQAECGRVTTCMQHSILKIMPLIHTGCTQRVNYTPRFRANCPKSWSLHIPARWHVS